MTENGKSVMYARPTKNEYILTKMKLFGERLAIESQCNRFVDAKQKAGYTFYHPVYNRQKNLLFHIWTIRTTKEEDSVAFFTVYDLCGESVDPTRDSRFNASFQKHFVKNNGCCSSISWANCCFDNLSKLLSFLRECNV